MACRSTCCCGGCSSPPVDRRLPTAAIQPMQQFCVACLPVAMCVTIDDGSNPVYSRVLWKNCEPQAPGSDPIIFTGSFSVNGSPETLIFRYVVSGGECQICLDGGSCSPVVISEPPYCEDPLGYTFEYEGATISTATADNISLIDRVSCTCCSCICRCICFHVATAAGVSTEQVCADLSIDGVVMWERSDGYIIRMGGEYKTGEKCSLTLEDPNGYDTGGSKPLEGDNKCPNPVIYWSYEDDEGNSIDVVFDCVYCDQCTGSVQDCCDRPVPRALVATVDMDCPTGCADFELALILPTAGTIWAGSHPTKWCGSPTSLEFSCAGGSWQIGGSPFITQLSVVSVECDPFRVEFTVEAVAVGICGGVEGIATGTIVVTE